MATVHNTLCNIWHVITSVNMTSTQCSLSWYRKKHKVFSRRLNSGSVWTLILIFPGHIKTFYHVISNNSDIFSEGQTVLDGDWVWECVCVSVLYFVLQASTHAVYNSQVRPPPTTLFLLTFLMKDKAATTYLRRHRHTQRSPRNTHPKTETRMKEGEEGILFKTKTSTRWPPETPQ